MRRRGPLASGQIGWSILSSFTLPKSKLRKSKPLPVCGNARRELELGITRGGQFRLASRVSLFSGKRSPESLSTHRSRSLAIAAATRIVITVQTPEHVIVDVFAGGSNGT
jgi:hypothetical protein